MPFEFLTGVPIPGAGRGCGHGKTELRLALEAMPEGAMFYCDPTKTLRTTINNVSKKQKKKFVVRTKAKGDQTGIWRIE